MAAAALQTPVWFIQYQTNYLSHHFPPTALSAVTPKWLKMTFSVIKKDYVAHTEDTQIVKELKNWFKQSRQLWWICGFCILVELHQEGSACSLRGRLISSPIFNWKCLLPNKFKIFEIILEIWLVVQVSVLLQRHLYLTTTTLLLNQLCIKGHILKQLESWSVFFL